LAQDEPIELAKAKLRQSALKIQGKHGFNQGLGWGLLNPIIY